jgi:hypothetical protein
MNTTVTIKKQIKKGFVLIKWSPVKYIHDTAQKTTLSSPHGWGIRRAKTPARVFSELFWGIFVSVR